MNNYQAAFLTISYLIYCLFFGGGLIFGACYVVFFREASGWWILVAFVVAGFLYKPSKWNSLLTGIDP